MDERMPVSTRPLAVQSVAEKRAVRETSVTEVIMVDEAGNTKEVRLWAYIPACIYASTHTHSQATGVVLG